MIVDGMLGLGDNLHQRAVVRQLMTREPVWLRTPWPSVYHDLVGERLQLLSPKGTRLRTQAKNAAREAARYDREPAGQHQVHRVWYRAEQIRAQGGFLAAMCHNSGLTLGDFSLPVPAEWQARARQAVGHPDKPIMVYRPLVDRTEWNGCQQRNPDAQAYATLAREVGARYHVVSLADLVPGTEWAVSEPIGADQEFHAGELDFETIAGLMSLAGLVWCSPGFALVLAQAVGAPMVAVFGGHESARLYDHGTPGQLFIQPRKPCECFSKAHACDKTINLDQARQALARFPSHQDQDTPSQ